MFKPVQMQKIRIVALNSISKNLVSELHELGVLEITKIPESELITNTPFSDYTTISSKMVQLRGIKNILEKYSIKPSKKEISENKIAELEEELKALVKESTMIKNKISKSKEELKLINKLLSFDVDFSNLKTSVTDYTLGMIPRNKFVSCKKALEKYKTDLRLLSKITKEGAILLILHRDDLVIDGLLAKFNFASIAVPKELTFPKEYKKKLFSDVQKLNTRLIEVSAKLTSLSESYYSSVEELLNRYIVASQRSEIASRFGFGQEMAVMEGWIEGANYEKLSKHFKQNFKNKAGIFKISASDKPPTKLENPSSMKAVEYFVHLFSLPNYRELDPTFIFFFVAPLFYGIIMGDVIYGFLSILIAYFLLKKLKPKGILLFTIRMWMFSAIPAIFFGLFYDEWMAMTHYNFFNYIAEFGLPIALTEPLYHGFSRIHNLSALLAISILIGVIHLALGFLFGAINEWHHSKKHAIAKIAWIGIDLGGAVAVMTYMFNMFPETIGMYAAGVMAFSALIVIAAEGIIGALELPGLAGNILSYARIAAVGVVGVILAEIINEFILPDPHNLLMALVMLPVLIILHLVNTLIVMLEALIQGGRLNIVEFQSKLMHGGGREFKPFMLKTTNTR